mgnify:CR=1 FL=1
MPELSNAGSGSRTSRSGRNNSKIQTSAGPTAKVQIQNQKLATQDSQSIMRGGLAEANAIGNMGKAMSGFFGTIAEVDSNLTQVERAEELRVANQEQVERKQIKRDQDAELAYQKRLQDAEEKAKIAGWEKESQDRLDALRAEVVANNTAGLKEREAKIKKQKENLSAAVYIGTRNSTVAELMVGLEKVVIDTHDVMGTDSFATKAEEFYTANFTPTGDLVLDAEIKNLYESKVFPYISKFAEKREVEIRTTATNQLSVEINGRDDMHFGKNFAEDFNRYKAINPNMGDNKVSANIINMYKNAANNTGNIKQFSRFINESAVIKVGDIYKTFADQFPDAASEILSKGWAEHQSKQTQESSALSASNIAQTMAIEFGPNNEEELAAAMVQAIEFNNLYGDEVNFNAQVKAIDEMTKKLGDLKASKNRWDAVNLGKPTTLKESTYKAEQLPRLLANPATDFTNADLSEEEFAQVSTNVTTLLFNNESQMGYVSDKVKSAISSMLTSPDLLMNQRGYALLQKMDQTDSAMSSKILSGNSKASTLYSSVSNNGVTLGLVTEDKDLLSLLQDPQVMEDAQEATQALYETKSPVATFTKIMNPSYTAFGGTLLHSPSIRKLGGALGVDTDDLFVDPNGAVANKFMDLHTAFTIAAQSNGSAGDPDQIISDVWDHMLPTLGRVRKTNDRVAVVLKADQVTLPAVGTVDENGNVNTQVHDVASMPNPYDPSQTISPSGNLNNSIDAVAKMDMFGGAGVGFRQNDDGTGTVTLTSAHEVTGQQQDVILEAGMTYDFGQKKGELPGALDNLTNIGLLEDVIDAVTTSSIPVEITGDPVVDEATLKAIEDKLPESVHLVPIYDAGTTAADIAAGAQATGYKIRAYAHISKDDVDLDNLYTDKEIQEMSLGDHVKPRAMRSYDYPAFEKRKNKDHNLKIDQAITKDRLPFMTSTSQSDADQNAMLQEGVMNQLAANGKVSPTVGLTAPSKAGMVPVGTPLKAGFSLDMDGDSVYDTAENISWFIQDAYKGIKEHMSPETSPEYTDQRFEMIAEAEAWRSESYWDGVKSAPNGKGYRTVGYGYNMDSVGHKDLFMKTLQVGEKYFDSVHKGTVQITEAQGRKLFDAAVGEAESIIDNRLNGVDLNHQQRLALVSMAYNSPKLIGENLVGHLKGGRMEKAVEEILYKSNGSRMLGLYNRRYEEALTFVGANREHGMPSYLAYMATVLPEKYAAKFAASKEAQDKGKAKV